MTTNPARSRVAHDSLGGDSRLRIDERGGVRFPFGGSVIAVATKPEGAHG